MWPWRENSSAAGHSPMSVIDHGCEIEGRLTFGGTLILNGKFQGEISSSDTLIVGEAGNLRADVRVGVAIISGQIEGQITALERVELRGNAQIHGDIVTPMLILDKGVIFNGHCKMKGEDLQVAHRTS